MYQSHAGTTVKSGGNGLAAAAAGIGDFPSGNELPLVNHIGCEFERNFGLPYDVFDGTVGMLLDKIVNLIFVIAHFIITFLTYADACIGEKFFTDGAVAEYALAVLCFQHIHHPFLSIRGILLPCRQITDYIIPLYKEK